MEKLLTCSLTKEPTSEPLICTKTGLIFDKSTITNFFGDARIRFCPITQIQIKLSEDFRAVRGLEGPSLGIKSSVSRLSAANKILENFRDVLLEAKTNQKTVNLLKKKLAASLRQQDASIRVIRRLIEERDDARRLLIDKRYEMTETGVEKMEIEESDENLRDEIKVSAIRLNKVRKELDKLYNRSPFAGLGIDQMTDSAVVEHGLEGIGRSSGTFIYCHPFDCDYYVLGVTQPSKPGSGQEAENEGILAHSVLSEASREQWSFSELKFFNFEEKKIFDLRDKFLEPRRIDTFTESSFYSDDEGFGFVSTLNDGKIYGGVVDFETAKIKQAMLIQTNRRYLALQEHPLSHILALLDDSRELSLLDLKRQRAVFEATIEDDLELTGLSCHPDGKLIALSGTNSQVHFFDLNSKQVVITLETSQVSKESYIMSSFLSICSHFSNCSQFSNFCDLPIFRVNRGDRCLV